MPLNADNELEHAPAAATDPAHASSANTDHTTASGEKPATLVEFVTDTTFIPTLDNAPLTQKLKSYLLLSATIFGAVATLWYCDFALFQKGAPPSVPEGPMVVLPAPPTFVEAAVEVGVTAAGVSVVVMALLFLTGTANIDYWSLVMEYGWYTLPAVAGVGVFFVMAKESSEATGDLV